MKVNDLDLIVVNAIESINSIGELEDFLSFLGKGNIYELPIDNAFAIYNQRPDATYVASVDGWKKTRSYPNQGTGIAVYPSNSNNIISNYTDFAYDISDINLGRTIKPWSATNEILEKFYTTFSSDNNFSPSEEDIISFFRSRFYLDINDEDYTINFAVENLDESTLNERWHLRKFISECCTKVFCARVGYEYHFSEDAISIFNYYFKSDDVMNYKLLTKVLDVAQNTISADLKFLGKFIIEEKRRQYYGFGNGDVIGTSRGYGEGFINRREAEQSNISDESGRNDRISRGEGSENSDIQGSSRSEEQLRSMGKDGSRLYNGESQVDAADTSEERGARENSENQREGSEGVLSSESGEDAAKGESFFKQEIPGEIESGRTNTSRADGSDYQGDIASSSRDNSIEVGTVENREEGISEGNDFEQLDLFSYMAKKSDSDEATDNVEVIKSSDVEIITNDQDINDEIINEIIKAGPFGFNKYGKYDVFNFYAYNWNDIVIEDAVKVVKKAYMGAALGFNIGGNYYSAYYDEDGLKISSSKDALFDSTVISWDDVEVKICDFIYENQYLDSISAELSYKYFKDGLIDNLVHYFIYGISVEKDKLPAPFNGEYNDVTIKEEVRKVLSDKTLAVNLLVEAKKLYSSIENGDIHVKNAYAVNSDVISKFDNYMKGHVNFDTKEAININIPVSITNDAIDMAIGLYSSSERGTYFRRECYNAYLESIDSLSKYIKEYFGIGGRQSNGMGVDFNQGLRISIALNLKMY